jgi:hypothetical protein
MGDTTLGVYAGSPGSLSLIGCNDDFYDLQSAVRFEATANTTYYIMVGFCCGNGETGGGSCMGSVMVYVPHNRQRGTCGDNGQQYNSLQP